MTDRNLKQASTVYAFREPVRADGSAIHSLIEDCPPLDVNSIYSYLLLCEHFSKSCVVAHTDDGRIDGFVSGYVPPERENVLFVWQVAVHERARGNGLAQRMLSELLERARRAGHEFESIETTVGPDNAASRKTFAHVARQYDAVIHEQPFFERRLFGGAEHEDERLLRIGPLYRQTVDA